MWLLYQAMNAVKYTASCTNMEHYLPISCRLDHADFLVQDCINFTTLVVELPQSCTEQLILYTTLMYSY